MADDRRTDAPATPQFDYRLDGKTLYLSHDFVLTTADPFLSVIRMRLRKFRGSALIVNLDELKRIDSAGVAALSFLRDQAAEEGVAIHFEGGSEPIQTTLETFALSEPQTPSAAPEEGFLEGLGRRTNQYFTRTLQNILITTADICYWSLADLFPPRAHRKGEFVHQAVIIGVNALPIVAVMSFLIGLVLALQSAAQLRQFGADVFIVDLTVIAMIREMGPLITAILVAGRSGSAIASEIATMKVTEELDALKTMALNPIRFIVVPKMQASIFTMPFLTVLATLMGIGGGMVVAYLYLDISPQVFANRMSSVLYFKDLVTGLIKSLAFAGVIVITGSYFGFQAKGGADGVGRVTTGSVVASIALVILADSFLGLIFY